MLYVHVVCTVHVPVYCMYVCVPGDSSLQLFVWVSGLVDCCRAIKCNNDGSMVFMVETVHYLSCLFSSSPYAIVLEGS